MRDHYLADPNYAAPGAALGGLAVLPPPVPGLHVFYASGQPTEVGAYYRTGPGEALEIDAEAVTDDPKFAVEHGLRVEVSGPTAQAIDGSKNSGGGTVPYGNLAYFKKWQADEFRTQIANTPVPGSSHAGILSTEVFLDGVAELVIKP